MDRLILALFALVPAILPAGAQTSCGTLSGCPNASTPLSGTEYLYVLQGGVSKKITTSNFMGVMNTILPLNNVWTGVNTFSGGIGSSLTPTTDNTLSLGSSADRWANGYFNALTVGTGLSIGVGNYSTATESIAIGAGALSSATADDCLAIGWHALYSFTTATASAGVSCGNVAIGRQALALNVTGGENTALGQFALANSTTSGNTAIGQAAMQQATTAAQNTAIGWGSLSGCPTGACANTPTGNYNTAIGYAAMASATSAHGNTAVGQDALFGVTSGAGNVAVGYAAGQLLTTQYSTVILGNCPGSGFASTAIYLCDGAGSIDATLTTFLLTIPGSLTLSGGTLTLPATGIVTFNGSAYALYGDATNTFVNVVSGGNVGLRVNNSTVFSVTASGPTAGVMPTSGGGTGGYVCRDAANGNLYVKAACP